MGKRKCRILLAIQILIGFFLALQIKSSIPPRRIVYIIMGVAFVTILCNIPISVRQKKWEYTILLICVSLEFFAFDIVNTRDIVLDGFRFLSNMLVILILYMIAHLIAGNVIFTTIVISTLLYIFNIAVYEVYVFRGIPIAPWDVHAIGTAADVANNYRFFTDEYMLYAWIITMLIQQTALKIDTNKTHKRERVCILGCVLGLISIYMCLFYPKLYGYLWDVNQAYIEEGVASGFIAHVQYALYQKPRGYSVQNANEILSRYPDIEGSDVETKAKNIIVIMNESFADLSCLGTDLQADYMPFIHSLSENTIKAELVVPVYGGGTSNTEFEALTGNSCAFRLQSPYETVIRNDTSSIVRELQREGFYCEAYHPGEPESWKRDKVYKELGFENFDTLGSTDHSKKDMLGRFASDQYDYTQLIQHFENRDQSKSYFMFNVTIQNHGGYDKERASLIITDEAKKYSAYPEVEQYLSLVQESDKQFSRLVNYFAKVKEPTIICFFGDHLPALSEAFMQDQENENKDNHRRYVTPMIIWANYEIKEADLGRISANYIRPLLLQTAGVSGSAYDSFLWDLYSNYPVFSTSGIDTSDKTIYETPYDIHDDMVKKYEILEYYQLKNYGKD